MRLLLATGSARAYMAPPELAAEQIYCGPDWKSETVAGRVVSLPTPVGCYDLAAIVDQLPPEQKPDAVVCLVDASRRSLPSNLAAIRCPKILLLADTHHLDSPITGLLGYVQRERYDRTVILYDRHHVDLLRAGGLKNLYWFPGLTFPHSDAVVRAARQTSRDASIVFIGQRGRHHPRRGYLLDALQAAQISVDVRLAPQLEALGAYGRALMGFNASLNGDLNLRAFEILSCGAVLLTDRLAPRSGLFDLWTEGKEMVTYGDASELVARASDLLEHPDGAAQIGAAGQAWFDQYFNAALREKTFAALLHDGVAPPQFSLPSDSLFTAPKGGWPALGSAIAGYEVVQELHRLHEVVTVCADAKLAPELVTACATLPRVRVIGSNDPARNSAHLLVIRPDEVGQVSLQKVEYVFVVADSAPATDRWREALALQGLQQLDPRWLIYRAGEGRAAILARQGAKLLETGDYSTAMQTAQWLLQMDPTSLDGHLIAAELALEMGKRPLSLKLFAVARQKAPKDPRVVAFTQSLAKPMYVPKLAARLTQTATTALAAEQYDTAIIAAKAALAASSGIPHAALVLARSLVAVRKAPEAVDVLQRALAAAPNDAALSALLGQASAMIAANATTQSCETAALS